MNPATHQRLLIEGALPMLLTALALLFFVFPGVIFASWPQAPEIASYQIDASLDTIARALTGHCTIHWSNTTTLPTSELRFHLYMNAFKSSQTTYAKEDPALFSNFHDWGSIEIKSLTVDERPIKWEFMAPDDHNSNDQTVARIALPEPVHPGAGIKIDMSFLTKLPRCLSRAGYAHDFFMLAQWYPKIGVLEGTGRWNCHQYHANSEFFADFGCYDVTIRLPAGFITAATGEEISRTIQNSTQVVKYHAIGVTDFAVAAQLDALLLRRTWTSPAGRAVAVHLFMQPEHIRYANRHWRAVQETLRFLDDWCGPYPFPVLTLVDPPFEASTTAGGMEYPLLFLTDTPLYESDHCLTPIEGTTVHETTHQYFQHMIASDEPEEPWLDEGITSYISGKIIDSHYGPSMPDVRIFRLPISWFLRLPTMTCWQGAKLAWLENPESDPANLMSWAYPDIGRYDGQVYDRTHLVLRGLENALGQSAMKEIFRRYFARFSFAHPRGTDFIKIVSGVAGRDMQNDFDQLLSQATAPDFYVGSVREVPGNPTRWRVMIGRHSRIVLPVDLSVQFADGTRECHRWDGTGRLIAFDFKKPVISAIIDPAHKILTDRNDINNSWTSRPDRSIVWGFSNLCSALVQFLISP